MYVNVLPRALVVSSFILLCVFSPPLEVMTMVILTVTATTMMMMIVFSCELI